MMMFSKITRIFVLGCLMLIMVTSAVFAQESDPAYQQKLKEIEELKGKISQLQSEAKTLSSTIAYLNGKKNLTEKQIEATKAEILIIERDIDALSGKINVLEGTLTTLIRTLMNDVQENYKQQKVNRFDLLFSSTSFSDAMTRYKYLQVSQQHHQDVLQKTTQAKMTYDDQKDQKEKKQKQVVALQGRLIAQQKDLIAQEETKQKLLRDTKNSEGNYQKLLAQAEAELSSFRSFVVSRGAGVLPPQNSPDGWFFSQRDERWAGACIGASCGTRNEGRILDVGCLVSATAMVKKKYGEDVTPLSIGRNSSYFFSNTAYMLQPWPAPSGYRYERSGYSQDKMDAEMREGRPVIVHLRIGTRDGHFVVFKSGEKGNYVMHDPIEGYDKKFTDFYRFSQINSMSVLRK